ncbi:hypothetical protein [Streptomyces sp. NPDC056190]|uniref:hypothetical protein n=1 Tax=Streptomyces sp. NPDC056190 TaxID=3345741 RepID=UPI0035D66A62
MVGLPAAAVAACTAVFAVDVSGHPRVDGHADDHGVQVAAGFREGVGDPGEDEGELGVLQGRQRCFAQVFLPLVVVLLVLLGDGGGQGLGIEVVPGRGHLDAKAVRDRGDVAFDGVGHRARPDRDAVPGEGGEGVGDGGLELLGVPHSGSLGPGLEPLVPLSAAVTLAVRTS